MSRVSVRAVPGLRGGASHGMTPWLISAFAFAGAGPAPARDPAPGVIEAGLWADLVVFDPDTITERSTLQAPNQLCVGMPWVLLNGVPVIANGAATHALPGKVLRGPASRARAADHL